MTANEDEILATLRALESSAQTPPGGTKPDILALLRRLDGLAAQLPPDGDRDLRHYLQRRSYEKARLLLEGRGAENQRGKCGH